MLARTRILLPVLALATLATASAAQKPSKALPRLRGTVQDTVGRPLEGAQLQILGLDRALLTPASGAYRFAEIKPGKYWVVVRRIGYAPLRTALSFNPGDDREFDFELTPLPHNLSAIKVRAEDKAWMRRYEEFVWRSKTSFQGGFLTRDDIDRSHAIYLGDVVRRYLPFTSSRAFFEPYFPSFRAAGASRRYLGSRLARFGQNCSPAVSVNGLHTIGGWAVNDFRPNDVEAVEVYGSGASLPLEFSNRQAACGLVIVWTR
jgi:hypothetical protein